MQKCSWCEQEIPDNEIASHTCPSMPSNSDSTIELMQNGNGIGWFCPSDTCNHWNVIDDADQITERMTCKGCRCTFPCEAPDEAVDIIASGYDWECPACGNGEMHHITEVPSSRIVICPIFNKAYEIADYDHAIE